MSTSKGLGRGWNCVALIGLACLTDRVDAAQLTYGSQSRSVASTAGALIGGFSSNDDNHGQAAPAFGPFDGQAISEKVASPGYPASRGAAYQHSRLMPTYVQNYGYAGGKDALDFGGIGAGYGYSTLTTSFSLDQPSGYDFGLNINGYLGNGSANGFNFPYYYSASLTGPGGSVFNTGNLNELGHLAYTGQLASWPAGITRSRSLCSAAGTARRVGITG